MLVKKAGTPSATQSSSFANGVEVQGAEGYGLFVGHGLIGVRVASADLDGVFVGTAGRDGVFVRMAGGDGVYVQSAGGDGLDIDGAGGVGIEVSGTTNEAAYFKRSVNAGLGLRNHVVLIENTASSATNGPDVLALRSSANPATENTNFITFFNGSFPNTAVGAVEGNPAGDGVTYKSGGGDFAEYLPRLHEGETLKAGDLVGVYAGHVTKATAGAEQVMIVTGRAAVLGNMPRNEEEEGYAAVAFVGQVPIRVVGPVEAGDLLVTSGREDGTARGVPLGAYTPEDGPVVGRALESSSGGEVLALVGVDEAASLRQVVERQQSEIELLRRELDALRRMVEESVPSARR